MRLHTYGEEQLGTKLSARSSEGNRASIYVDASPNGGDSA